MLLLCYPETQPCPSCGEPIASCDHQAMKTPMGHDPLEHIFQMLNRRAYHEEPSRNALTARFDRGRTMKLATAARRC